MNQLSLLWEQLQFELHGIWQRRWIGSGVAWAVAVIGAVALLAWNDRYQASAKVYVDTQTVLKPLMAGLAFQPDIDQQVRMLARTLISHPNVEQLLKSPDVGLDQPPAGRLDQAVERLKDQIKFSPSGQNLYEISYRDPDAARARRLVDKLVDLFVNSNSNEKRRDSAEASRFIDEQIKVYETKLTDAESRLKDFKVRNFGVTGVANQDYFARISTLSDEVNKLRLDLTSAEQSRDAVKRELAREDPQLPPESMPSTSGRAASETETRLETQRKLLDDLLRRYTEEHPDVVSVRRTIAQLEAQRRVELDARGASGHGNAATNPVYQQLRISLASAEGNVASLRTQLGIQQGRLDQARAMASRIPEVEAEFAQLNRDYDVIRKNYDQLVTRREAASLGVKIDQTSGLTDFRVVEPPQVSATPVFPGRKVLAVMLVLAAIAAGFGASYVASHFAGTVINVKALADLTRRPVLGTVSLAMNGDRALSVRRQRFAFAGVAAAFLILNATWVAWVATSSQA